MTVTEVQEYLISLRGGGIRPGLERMQRAMDLCGDAPRRLRVVHVAGTNGKGSTARMIQCMLTAAGYRTGLYTSPAVGELCDTITIDGTPIEQEAFAALATVWRERQAAMGEVGTLSEFEFVTALTLDYFAQQRVDICVLECGLGGRGDATNVCPPPLAAVFTPIALDHPQFLGNAVEAIATEKCGIIKPPCRVIAAPTQSPEALAVIYEQAALHGLTVRQPQRAAATLLEHTLGGVRFAYDDVTYTVPLGGAFQVDNALTALETVTALSDAGFAVDTAARQAGLAAATLPCRQELVSRTPPVVLDGAHNPHAIAALADTIKAEMHTSLTLLIGMLRDKDTAVCASLLAPLAAQVVCCTPPSERALPAEELAAQFIAAGAKHVTSVNDPVEALATAQSLAGEGALLVGGSFYTAAAVWSRLLAIGENRGK